MKVRSEVADEKARAIIALIERIDTQIGPVRSWKQIRKEQPRNKAMKRAVGRSDQ